jgi:glucokinase
MNSELQALNFVLGIDLGGTSIKAVAVTPAGELLAQQNVSFVDQDMEWAVKTRALVKRFQAEDFFIAGKNMETGATPVLRCLGLSAPGLAAADGRGIAFMPGRLLGLEGLDWTDYLGAAQPVRVLNDAHAALLGEVWLGAARGLKNVCLLTLGTGVGGAAMVDGHLLRGAMGRAGHLGHTVVDWLGPRDTCNAPGSLELFIGNKTIHERTGGRFATTHALVAAVESDDKAAEAMWLKSVRALACAVASFVNILDPEAVILGGGIARAGRTLFEPLQKFLDEVEWQPGGRRVQLLPAQLGEMAGAFGAAAHALKKFD